MEERDATQSAVIFHPKTIQVVKFKADLLATQEEDLTEAAQEKKRQRREQQKAQEDAAMDSELQVLVSMQEGAHSVQTSVGAGTLRRLDLQQFRNFLKRKHEESGVTNRALDEEFRARKALLKPLEIASFSMWPMELQQAWQGNLFAPTQDPQGPEQYDMGNLKTSYLQMKKLLKDNRCPLEGHRLMQDLPQTQLDMYTYPEGTENSLEGRLARLLPEHSTERKMATTQRKLEFHLRERWAERVIGILLPYAKDIPHMRAVQGNKVQQEYLDLLGDTRFHTLRIHCLCFENIQKLGFNVIPWKESDIRNLLNTMRDQEITPHKLQSIWNTLRWFSAKFGLMDPDSLERLKAKRKTRVGGD